MMKVSPAVAKGTEVNISTSCNYTVNCSGYEAGNSNYWTHF